MMRVPQVMHQIQSTRAIFVVELASGSDNIELYILLLHQKVMQLILEILLITTAGTRWWNSTSNQTEVFMVLQIW